MIECRVRLSHTVSPGDMEFLNGESDREKTTRSDIVRRAIEMYRETGQRKARDAVKMLA